MSFPEDMKIDHSYASDELPPAYHELTGSKPHFQQALPRLDGPSSSSSTHEWSLNAPRQYNPPNNPFTPNDSYYAPPSHAPLPSRSEKQQPYQDDQYRAPAYPPPTSSNFPQENSQCTCDGYYNPSREQCSGRCPYGRQMQQRQQTQPKQGGLFSTGLGLAVSEFQRHESRLERKFDRMNQKIDRKLQKAEAKASYRMEKNMIKAERHQNRDGLKYEREQAKAEKHYERDYMRAERKYDRDQRKVERELRKF